MKKLMKFYKRLSFAQGAAFAVSLTSVVGIAANNIPGFFTFTTGQVISSSQVNSNFDKLAQLIEDNQSQTFIGTWNASSNLPDIDVAPPMSGGYYVVTTAGTHNSIAYSIGDWAIWNGTAWSRIQNISGVSSVFGRTGTILKAKGDYVLTDLGDVDLLTTPPNAGQVLQFNGSNWLPGTLPVITETDPTVMAFAKTALPTCSGSQALRTSGSTFVCAPIFSGSANTVVVTNGTGELLTSPVTASELNYLSGVTSGIQAQLNTKINSGSLVDWSTPGVPTIDPSRLNLGMTNRVVVTNISGAIEPSSITTNELNFIAGLNTNLQTQLNGKVNINVPSPTVSSDAVNKMYVDTALQYVKATNSTFTGIGFTSSSYAANVGTANSFIGTNAGNSNSTGQSNTFVGFESGRMSTTGSNNTGLGNGTLTASGVKSFNTAIGSNSMMSATTGQSNTAIGAASLGALTTGSNNTIIGKNAGVQVSTGSSNIMIGYSVGQTMSSGEENIIIGNSAGPTTGTSNIVIGNSGAISLAGNNNVIIGGNLASLNSLTNTIVLATAGATAIERMRIDTNGNMGLGTTAPADKLSIVGNVTATGTISATSFPVTSDRRLKKNIVTVQNALEKVLKLRGVEFDWIKTGVHEIGVIAQEVEKIVPDLVMTNSKGFKSVKYANMVSLLIESTKETDEKITALESENKMLKGYLCAKDPAAPFCH
ncbi:tail fiber domain-containing protein [Bacteriovorax sp. PP10]|uniref:Tail fiber domain-containing protein n=1 Tax=Bacteriovorax antarcticus TaxID=3088717 RepID=A0ABU5VSP4_9BACT|nr:tail fiber domain-containing protein [Bacteriovorax sp. PP10]MEA9356026.1 tail fiber domain-containing protein [Bacteriovorax sp. PP10]